VPTINPELRIFEKCIGTKKRKKLQNTPERISSRDAVLRLP